MSKKITRRASLDALVLTSTIVNGALAQPRAAFGGVRVGIASLRAEVGNPTARDAEELPGAVAQALASVGRARAPVAVRVDTAILGSSSGGQGPQGTSPDQILGEVIVGGAAWPLRASTSYYSMAVDQALVEQSHHDRVSQLVQAFAYWAAREV
jgi:hypothetical protein